MSKITYILDLEFDRISDRSRSDSYTGFLDLNILLLTLLSQHYIFKVIVAQQLIVIHL